MIFFWIMFLLSVFIPCRRFFVLNLCLQNVLHQIHLHVWLLHIKFFSMRHDFNCSPYTCQVYTQHVGLYVYSSKYVSMCWHTASSWLVDDIPCFWSITWTEQFQDCVAVSQIRSSGSWSINWGLCWYRWSMTCACGQRTVDDNLSDGQCISSSSLNNQLHWISNILPLCV